MGRAGRREPGRLTREATSPAVEVRGLRVRYRGASEDALDGVDLTVERGELVAVLGATGAGKTTLCRAISGLVPHAIKSRVEGEVAVDGVSAGASSVVELSQRVGSVFQDAESQIFGLTVESDAAFVLENLAMEPKEIRTRVDMALRQVRMEPLAERPSYELSGGQKQRLVIAAALAMRPPVLVLDEPTAELDPIGKRQLLELLSELAREGVAVVVAEQMTDGLAELFDRGLVLERGRPLASGPITELLGDVAKLEKAGVRPPQVALALHLASPGENLVPATLESGVAYVRARHDGRPLQTVSRTQTGNMREARRSEAPAIEAEDITFAYPGGVEALRGVSFEVGRGEMVALVGENGAGKSTFARCLNGLLRPKSGTLWIGGVDTKEESVAGLARRVGYVFQNPDHQIWAETVRDELSFGPRNLGFDEEKTEASIKRALQAVDLRVADDDHPNFLGGGERQKLAVAGVLAMEPDILVLDEPATGLDWPATKAMMRLVSELNAEGHTIVVITHDMWILAEYIPRAIVMSGGRVIGDGPTGEILADEPLLAEACLEAPEAARLALALGMDATDAATLGRELRALIGAEA